jgi:ABC-type antimicrobial peptide transport system permease subunit
MAGSGSTSWNGEAPTNIEIEIDIALLAARLAADPDFIRLISNKVRKELTKDARTMGNLFGKWAGR